MELLIDNVLNIGEDEFYRTQRYKLPLVVILINTEDRNAFDILNNCTRQTDIIQQLDYNLLVVFLTHTDFESSKKFIEKIENKFTLTYTSAEYKNNPQKFIEELFLQNSNKYDGTIDNT